ncbi:MAG: methyltransferase [Pelagibacterales bacterium]|nr:methyltransferase [Pelagibacterales bacterium]OUU61312.1 MAG: hypothetical protein CBC22_08010 [Alphaproteobacteria bacterium TMED62]
MKFRKLILFLIFFCFCGFYVKLAFSQSLESVINSKNRTPNYVDRDKYRNPLETLNFFKINNKMKVIELQPSGGNSPGGWYTEILAPYLQKEGKLIAAHFNPNESKWRAKMRKGFEERIKKNPDFKNIEMSVLSMPPTKLSSDNSVDMVLTFRNLHNWLKAGYLKEVFQVTYDALKPGGIFGVVEHRAPSNFSIKDMNKTGYVTEDLAINFATSVGFLLEESSEINSNNLDAKDHSNGVWNLLPTLKLSDPNDIEKYLIIGESDRMTLRFIKPIN